MADSKSLVNRMIRAAKLEVDLYEEVEADTTATGQAFQAVVIASVASGLGAGIWTLFHGDDATVGDFFLGLVLGVIFAIVGWLAWSVLTYWLGTTLFRGPETSATIGELMRTLGFANSPKVLGFFIFIPFLGWLISVVVLAWVLVAAVIAVRQALDFDTWRAIGTVAVGWVIYLVLSLLLGWIL